MTDMTKEDQTEDRRTFFKTVGRNLVLGVTGGGIALMIKHGQISTCINVASPCTTCVALKQGCELPKADAHRKQVTDDRPA